MDISEKDMKCLTDGISDNGTDPAIRFSIFGVLSKDVHRMARGTFPFPICRTAGLALEAISKLIRAESFRSQFSLFVSMASSIPK
jgi:hypothetical protein